MEEKLTKLYNECIEELKEIGIDMQNEENIGKIDISLSKRNTKRYGCCKQENPDRKYKTITRLGFRKIVKYEKFNNHHIEVSKWVMQLDDNIIKNTIMHELIHCIPLCNNHGAEFKKYAKYINKKLGYNIQRVGNPKEDYEKSNLKYEEKVEKANYELECEKCGQQIFRQRFNVKKIKQYRCGKCGGKLKIIKANVEKRKENKYGI